MSGGPGKYDPVATMVREGTQARAVVLMVLDGNVGSGFSVQTTELKTLLMLPSLLRDTADQIEADIIKEGMVP